MRTLLNILWNVPGLGFVAAFFWVLAGLLMAVTIIGLPWAKACFTLANYTLGAVRPRTGLAPRRDRARDTRHRRARAAGECRLVPARRLVADRPHVFAACACAITIVGIPFAWAHLKLAAAAIAPVGKVVVPAEVAMAIDREKASGWLYGRRR